MNVDVNRYEGVPVWAFVLSTVLLVIVLLSGLPTLIKVAAIVIASPVFIVSGLQILGRAGSLRKGDWADLHYPLMIRYAKAAGYLSAKDEKSTQHEIDKLIKSREIALTFLYTFFDEQSAADEVWFRALSRAENFKDEAMLKGFFLELNSSMSNEDLNSLLKQANSELTVENPRMVIAEAVEEQYGDSERDKYIQAVVLGHAN